MATDTKEKMLDTAFRLFAEKGYEGTNIRELSNALGLTKSAFYKHFESKDDVLAQIIDKLNNYYDMHFGSQAQLPKIPESAGEFTELATKMINFTVHDERIIMSRKIILTEQFHNDRLRLLATEHFNVGPENFFTKIFEGMTANGTIDDCDAKMTAFSFTAPISNLILLADRMPERMDEILEKAEAFIKHFVDNYHIKE